ncbi:hypothetical protein PC128_g16375 [Phytophthora cactorum]|nr:hypothetical protein PC128_g16375 [Phytophthora cactorum]
MADGSETETAAGAIAARDELRKEKKVVMEWAAQGLKPKRIFSAFPSASVSTRLRHRP